MKQLFFLISILFQISSFCQINNSLEQKAFNFFVDNILETDLSSYNVIFKGKTTKYLSFAYFKPDCINDEEFENIRNQIVKLDYRKKINITSFRKKSKRNCNKRVKLYLHQSNEINRINNKKIVTLAYTINKVTYSYDFIFENDELITWCKNSAIE